MVLRVEKFFLCGKTWLSFLSSPDDATRFVVCAFQNCSELANYLERLAHKPSVIKLSLTFELFSPKINNRQFHSSREKMELADLLQDHIYLVTKFEKLYLRNVSMWSIFGNCGGSIGRIRKKYLTLTATDRGAISPISMVQWFQKLGLYPYYHKK